MAHPYSKFKESDAGKARAKHLTKGYASGGAVKKRGDTNIKIAIITPGAEAGARPPMMSFNPVSPGGGPPPMPMPPPGAGPGGPPPGMMQRGGKVKMTAGAETGVGRLQKAKAIKGK